MAHEHEPGVYRAREVLSEFQTHTARAARDQVDSALSQPRRRLICDVEPDLFEVLHPAMTAAVSDHAIRTVTADFRQQIFHDTLLSSACFRQNHVDAAADDVLILL